MFRIESQARFWLIVFALFIAALWVLKPVLMPFLVALALAYFLNPVVNALEQRKIPRWVGSLVVLFGFMVIAGTILMLILPLLHSQIGALMNALPSYIQKLRGHYIPGIETWLSRFSPEDVQKLRDAAAQSASEAAGWIANVFKQIISDSFAVIDVLLLMVLTPVVAYYMLRDWPRLLSVVDTTLPRRHYDLIREQMRDIDSTLSGFVRGQALVCLSLGLIYSIGLSVVGLEYGMTIGIISGVFSFIPYVGTIFGWITSIILALVQFDNDWLHIGMVAGVYYIGHVLEAYFLTPKLVGHRVGLHPVWVLFALITGVKLMGFVGVLIAVPSAAVIGVLTRFAVRQYKKSSLYKDPLAAMPPQ